MNSSIWPKPMADRIQRWFSPASEGGRGLALPAVGWWAWLLFAIACALLLCSTAFFFEGHKVDESEVVLNALTIATGDWNPKWSPGYGHLAMYVPAAILALIAFLLQLSGAAATYFDGLYLLFADDGAYRVVRVIYALADVATALLFARIIMAVTHQRVIAAAYFVYFMVSPDTWTYANYIRTDTFVSFFTACAIYALVVGRTRWTPYVVGISIGAAIACKYSAVVYIALAACLLIPMAGEVKTFRQRLGMTAIAVVAAVLSALIFQPLYDYAGVVASIGENMAGTRFAREAVPLGDRLTRLWQLVLTLEPLALVLLLTTLATFQKPRQSAPVIIALALGIVPFVLSNFVREYWLIPFADVLRCAGWLGVACLVQLISTRAGLNLRRVTVGVVLLVSASIAWARLPTLPQPQAAPKLGLSNAEAAKRWLYVHAANRVPVVYGYEKNFLLPRAYSFGNYDQAADLSRVFIFYREDFQPLHRMFRHWLYTDEFAEFSSMVQVPALKLSVSSAIAARGGEPPKMCMNNRCFPAKATACSARAQSQLGACVTYSWDMDRPAFRHDLSLLSLKMSPAVSEFALCWYNCDAVKAETKARTPHGGRVQLLKVADRLFAPARVLRLTEIKNGRNDGDNAFIVTTPEAYLSWLPKADLESKEGPSAAFAKRINARLVRYFDMGSGKPIEIYVRQKRR